MPNLNLTAPVHTAEKDQLVDDLAGTIMTAALKAVKERDVFHLALSGGSTPEVLYARMVTCPTFRGFPWGQTHIWIVDERRVPETDDKSNAKMIRESLVSHVDVNTRRFHTVPVAEEDNAATIYDQEVRDVVGEGQQRTRRADEPPRIDFVLLGMGDDCHTASLFPESPALKEGKRLVVGNDGPKVTPPPRITMTFPLINAAREVAVLVTGAKKTAALGRVQQQAATGKPDIQTLPITGVDPQDGQGAQGGELMWYVDREAAGA